MQLWGPRLEKRRGKEIISDCREKEKLVVTELSKPAFLVLLLTTDTHF